MSHTLEAWNRQPFAANFELPDNPAECDDYIMRVIRILYRDAETRLGAAAQNWHRATGFERDMCRYDLHEAIHRHRRIAKARNELVSARYADKLEDQNGTR